ncbi:hypothetical protein ACVWW7_003924 [Bradyrhizobium sp. LM6.9]
MFREQPSNRNTLIPSVDYAVKQAGATDQDATGTRKGH